MKSRQISGIHLFSGLLQLQWLCVIDTPFLDSQCSNQRATQQILFTFSYSLSCTFMEN